jgi:hypothetical protein
MYFNILTVKGRPSTQHFVSLYYCKNYLMMAKKPKHVVVEEDS